jgi:hypothetical protein
VGQGSPAAQGSPGRAQEPRHAGRQFRAGGLPRGE